MAAVDWNQTAEEEEGEAETAKQRLDEREERERNQHSEMEEGDEVGNELDEAGNDKEAMLRNAEKEADRRGGEDESGAEEEGRLPAVCRPCSGCCGGQLAASCRRLRLAHPVCSTSCQSLQSATARTCCLALCLCCRSGCAYLRHHHVPCPICCRPLSAPSLVPAVGQRRCKDGPT